MSDPLMKVHIGTDESFIVHDLQVPLQRSNLENWCIGVRLQYGEQPHPREEYNQDGFIPINLYAISKFFTAVPNLGTQNLIAEAYKHPSATLTASVVVVAYQLL